MNTYRLRTLVLLAALPLGGCASLEEVAIEQVAASRNDYLARQAWDQVKHYYYDIPSAYRKHFEVGFLAGFTDVASGGDGCLPGIPPQKYWAPCFQTPVGHKKVQHWFDGFQVGAIVAKRSGVGRYHRIPTAICSPPPIVVDAREFEGADRSPTDPEATRDTIRRLIEEDERDMELAPETTPLPAQN